MKFSIIRRMKQKAKREENKAKHITRNVKRRIEQNKIESVMLYASETGYI